MQFGDDNAVPKYTIKMGHYRNLKRKIIHVKI
jgi:hypothetical protein